MGLRTTLLVVYSLTLCLCALPSSYALPGDVLHRAKRQEPDLDAEPDLDVEPGPEPGTEPDAEPDAEPDEEPDDYVKEPDYAGNENDSLPKNTLSDSFRNTDNINEDNFDQPTDKKGSHSSEEKKTKKKAKKHKYLKKTVDFLKRVLDPDKLMQNAYITEMLRRFSEHAEPEYEDKESEEHEPQVVHTPKPTKRRRGRPRKKELMTPGIKGMLKKGVMNLMQMDLDPNTIRRRVRLIKRIARKAKKPLKTAVKIFLSSRNQGGGFGGGGYGGNTNY